MTASNRYYRQEKMETDPVFKLKANLRKRLRAVLKRNSHSGRAVWFLGCSGDYLKHHLQSKFKRGMSWENYGKDWVVDHIIPLARFDLTDTRQAKIACHFTNLQPLWSEDNHEKADKLTKPQMSLLL